MPPRQQDGNFGPDTREVIQFWRSTRTSKPQSGPLQSMEIVTLLGVPKVCDLGQYQNAFERFVYPSATEIKALQRALAAKLGVAVVESGRLDEPTRNAIRALQRQRNEKETGAMTAELEATL